MDLRNASCVGVLSALAVAVGGCGALDGEGRWSSFPTEERNARARVSSSDQTTFTFVLP